MRIQFSIQSFYSWWGEKCPNRISANISIHNVQTAADWSKIKGTLQLFSRRVISTICWWLWSGNGYSSIWDPDWEDDRFYFDDVGAPCNQSRTEGVKGGKEIIQSVIDSLSHITVSTARKNVSYSASRSLCLMAGWRNVAIEKGSDCVRKKELPFLIKLTLDQLLAYGALVSPWFQ